LRDKNTFEFIKSHASPETISTYTTAYSSASDKKEKIHFKQNNTMKRNI